MEPSAEPSKQPRDWWRVITGIISIPLVGAGLWVIAVGASYFFAAQSGVEECPFFDPTSCSGLVDIGGFGVVIAVLGVPFFIATFVPVGTFRAATKPPSAWPRVITGAIALPMLGGAAVLLGYMVTSVDCPFDCTFEVCDTDGLEEECFRWGFLFSFVALPLTVAGTLLALATAVPFGRFSRAWVGMGAALPGFIVLGALGGFGFGFGLAGLIVALAGAAGFFYLGYRVAR